jgi:hypothetical protein
LKKEH